MKLVSLFRLCILLFCFKPVLSLGGIAKAYPEIKNYTQQPKEYYKNVLEVSEDCTVIDVYNLEKKSFPEHYRDYPTIQSKANFFSFENFAQANRIPIPVHTLSQQEIKSFNNTTQYLVQDMLIKEPDNKHIAIPNSLKQFEPLIKTIFSIEFAENEHFNQYYAYLTIDQRDVTEGTSLRTPNWHVDGMHQNPLSKRISHVYTIVSTECGNNITEYVNQAFPELVDFDYNRYNLFNAIEYLVKPENIYQANNNTIYYMDAYTVHRSPVAQKNVGKRTFLRVQFADKKFDRIGNTVNPYFRNSFTFTTQHFPELEDPLYLKNQND